ncbi:hypothetical protein F4808DRAFT_456226 [Astrocystis sublimbata]|nr:hypothetical protein F4808DRAFT_456226 [Astrocystis sublimbata]
MCREVNFEPLGTIDGYVANLKSNIVDYIDAKRRGSPIVVWEPERFEEFKRYTLSSDKYIDQKEAKRGNGFLATLLQNLRRLDAAKTRNLKEEANTDGKYEVPLIHGSETDLSPPRRTVEEGFVDPREDNPANSIASLLPDEIPCSPQRGAKRKIYASTQVDDLFRGYEVGSSPVLKRFRNARSL